MISAEESKSETTTTPILAGPPGGPNVSDVTPASLSSVSLPADHTSHSASVLWHHYAKMHIAFHVKTATSLFSSRILEVGVAFGVDDKHTVSRVFLFTPIEEKRPPLPKLLLECGPVNAVDDELQRLIAKLSRPALM